MPRNLRKRKKAAFYNREYVLAMVEATEEAGALLKRARLTLADPVFEKWDGVLYDLEAEMKENKEAWEKEL